MTFSFKNTRFGEVFAYMLRMNDLAYSLIGKTLVVGTTDTKDAFYGRLILGLYRLDSGEAELVFQSASRDRLYYAGGANFAHLGSSAFDDSFESTVKYEDGELIDMTYTTDPADYVSMDLTPLG